MNETTYLFRKFYSVENLGKAYDLLKSELKDSTLPVDPLLSPVFKAIDNNREAYLKSLSWLIKNKQYAPSKAEYMYFPKPSFNMRKVALLTVTDRIVYQALLNYDVMGQVLHNNWTSVCLSPNIASEGKAYFEKYKTCWDNYLRAQINAFEEGFEWRLEFDIETFYDSIDHKKLNSILTSDCKLNRDETVHTLLKLLNTWTNHPNRGIPQGPNPSSALANVYLTAVDKIALNLGNHSVRTFRYADDFVLMGKDKKSVFEVFEKMNYKVVELGLNLNTKSNLVHLSDRFDLENRRFSNDYDAMSNGSIKKVFAISPEIPFILKDLIEDKKVEKDRLGRLKYYIKSTKFIEDPDLIKDFLVIYPKVQHLSDELCRFYLGNSYFYPLLVQTHIYDIYKDEHTFRWAKYRLAKLLLSFRHTDYSDDSEEVISLKLIQRDLKSSLIQSCDWLFNSLGYLYVSTENTENDAIQNLLEHFDKEPSITAKSAYISAIANSSAVDQYQKLINRQLYNTVPIDIQILALDIAKVRNIPIHKHEYMDLFTKRFLGMNPIRIKEPILTSPKNTSTTNIKVVNTQKNVFYINKNEILDKGKKPVGEKPKEAEIGFTFYVDEDRAEYTAHSGKSYLCDKFELGYNYSELFRVFSTLHKEGKLKNTELDGMIKQRKQTNLNERETSSSERVSGFVSDVHKKLKIKNKNDFVFRVDKSYCHLLSPIIIRKSKTSQD